MKKVLILGHRGMLGRAVLEYFKINTDFVLSTVSSRWGDDAFEKELRESDAEFIINCIGIIPHKKPTEDMYTKINHDLPVFLESLGKKVILPTTDCEFDGSLPFPEMYTKEHERNATDIYGKSKADISKLAEKEFKNTKIIRTSIVGHEETSHLAFLDWFLHAEHEVNGYTNHYWNGITTVMWAELCRHIVKNWDEMPVLNQYGTEKGMSKYDILYLFKEVYGKENITIKPFATPVAMNRTVLSDIPLPSLREQLQTLRAFYNK